MPLRNRRIAPGPVPASVPLFYQPLLDELEHEEVAPPEEWASRLLYLGERGAENWLAVVGDQGYVARHADPFGLADLRAEAVRGVRAGSLISLGPGDGVTDLSLIRSLKGDERLSYLPADLSDRLLQEGIERIVPHADVPAGLVCDWEGSPHFLIRAMKAYAPGPWLVGLLGGTLGNLDCGVDRFLAAWRRELRPGDRMLLDVPLMGGGWNLGREARLSLDKLPAPFRRFVVEAILRRDPSTRAEELLERFEEYICTEVRADSEHGIPVVQVCERQSGRPILRFRRFDWERLLERFVELGFSLHYAQASRATAEDSFAMGVVLLGSERQVSRTARKPGRSTRARKSQPRRSRRSGSDSADTLGHLLAEQGNLDCDPDPAFLYRDPGFARAQSVLVLGWECGEYMAKLSRACPHKSLHSREMRSKLLNGAGATVGTDVNAVSAYDIGQYDFVFARIVAQQRDSVEEFLAAAGQLIRPGGTLLVQDANDEGSLMFPDVDIRRDLLDRMDDAQRARDTTGRGVMAAVEATSEKFGLTRTYSENLAHRATTRGQKRALKEIMSACFDLASTLYGADVDAVSGKAKLERWLRAEGSYGQMGTRVSFFRKGE